MQLLIVMIVHVFVAFALIALVLLQRGKGSEMGAAFGAGASGTMFGSQGATPFMVKLIAGLAVLFFCTTLSLNYLVSKENARQQVDVLDLSEPGSNQPQAPLSPANTSKPSALNKSQQTPENTQS